MIKSIIIGLAALLFPISESASMDVHKIKQDGLSALMNEDHTVPVVSLRMVFDGGKRLVPEGKEGVAQLASYLLMEGAGKLDAEAISDQMVELAANISFSAERDGFSVSITSVSDAMLEAVDLALTMLTKPTLAEEDLARTKQQMLASIRRRMNDPQSLAFATLARTAYPNVSQGRGETRGSVEGLTKSDVEAYLKDQVQSAKLLLSMAGDLDQEQARQILARVASALPEGQPMPKKDFHDMSGQGQQVLVSQDVPQSTAVMAVPGLLREDDDFLAAYVMNHILGGGGFSSRLTDEIREKRGLAYSAASFLAPSRETAGLMIYFATRNDAVMEAVQVAKDVVADVAQHGVTEDELRDAKDNLTGSYPLRFDSNGKIAGHLMGLQISNLPMDYHMTRNALVEAITGEDIKRVAKKLLGDFDPLLVVSGSPENFAPSQSWDGEQIF